MTFHGVHYEIESTDERGIVVLFRRGKRGAPLAPRWICRVDGSGFRRWL